MVWVARPGPNAQRGGIDKLNGALNEGLKSPELQASMAKLGLQPRTMTPREFGAKLADEARDWQAAVTESGVKID